MEKQIHLLANKGKCPVCNEIIQSYFRHNYVKCSCGASFTDGGQDYMRCSSNLHDLSVYSNQPFEVIREHWHRNGYGKDMQGPYQSTVLCNMSDEYLQALMEFNIADFQKEFVEKEIQYRKQNNITITESKSIIHE